jgi:uncharacterized protein with von Willebrand factor type A (vWA) domain
MIPLLAAIPAAWTVARFAASRLLFKPIKYFIDSQFREPVTPVPGSVLYADLWVAVEHSGIYLGDGQISNIEVEGFAEGAVRRCGPPSFVSKSKLGKKIYVSCNSQGAVGHDDVATGADNHVGERSFYGLVIKNCHQFSEKCVNYAEGGYHGEPFSAAKLAGQLLPSVSETWEMTINSLKKSAKERLGATKWRLWNWQDQPDKDPEPDWNGINQSFEDMPLNEQTMAHLRQELAEAQAYSAEIADENIPEPVRKRLATLVQLLTDISATYEQAKPFLARCPGADFSYGQLKAMGEDFAALAAEMGRNRQVHELVRQLGRDHIREEDKKKQTRIPQCSKTEVHGTHLSNDVMRLLPSELINLEDDTLEALFYARLLESNLQTYQLAGTTHITREDIEKTPTTATTGPVVALLDTSGSMQGQPLLKARALLLAIAGMLQKEQRSLHVVLFGSAGELREFAMESANQSGALMAFLRQGFGGGTDFEAPLRRAFAIIQQQTTYQRADVLLISDGDCSLSDTFTQTVRTHKTTLDCLIYSVLCNGQRVSDSFSDEVMVL